MDQFLLLDFQINRLGYQFKNIDLLQEALTHSLQLPEDGDPNFPRQNRTLLQRLQIIGNAVVKFTISQYVVQTSKVSHGEGFLTARKDALVNGTQQKLVGERLFRPYAAQGRDNLFKILRFQKSFKMVENPVIPYEKFVRALMGAVYIDAGGISGDGLQASTNLFLRLWKESLDVPVAADGALKKIGHCFPQPTEEILKFWGMNGVGQNFIAMVEASIGVCVQKQYLLGEALIQRSFYEKYGGSQQHFPDYQRLEFLGDSVLGLVITEVLWKGHSFDEGSGTPLDHKIRDLIDAKAQKIIFDKLDLKKLVKMKAGGIPVWKMHDDIVESVVGAIYVDGGGVAVKEFIVKTWNLKESSRTPNLEDLQQKLGYKFQSKHFLVRALSLPGGTSNAPSTSTSEEGTQRSKKLREVLKYFGKSWIEFHATEYTLRSSAEHDSLPILVHRRNLLCGEKVLQRIASYLNLSSYVSLSRDQLNRGMELYMFYEDVIQSIIGAIFKDMQEASIKMSLGKVFYRLWNPFLNRCPFENLLNIFPNPGLRNSQSPRREFEELESNLRHSFENHHVLKQALISNQLGNTSRYSFMGEVILDLAVRVYVAILCHMELDNPEKSPNDLDVYELHSVVLSDCMDRAEILFDIDLIRGYQASLDDRLQTSSYTISDAELITRLFGAIYIDMSRKSADLTFSDWKKHFMITCQFITGRQQEE